LPREMPKSDETNSLVMEFINYNQSLNLEPLYKDNGGMLPPPYHHGNTIINPVPVPSPGPVPNAGAKEKEKGLLRGRETIKQTEPVIAEMLTEIKAFLGYPDKTNQDLSELCQRGQFLKKMSDVTYPGRNTKLLEDEVLSSGREFISLRG